jgi:hypothetical protein
MQTENNVRGVKSSVWESTKKSGVCSGKLLQNQENPPKTFDSKPAPAA